MSDVVHACIATATRQAARRLTLLYDSCLAAAGLRSTQYVILAEIARAGDALATTKELAARLVIERSAMGQTLRPLMRDGLIETASDPADRRRRPVRLTAKGRDRLVEARAHWVRAQARVHKLFGKPQMDALRIKLHAIADDARLEPPPAKDKET